MIRLCAALVDGSFIDEEFPDHEVELIEFMIKGTPEELFVRIELEDKRQNIIYTFSRKPNYVY